MGELLFSEDMKNKTTTEPRMNLAPIGRKLHETKLSGAGLFKLTVYGKTHIYQSCPLAPTEYLDMILLLDKAGAVYSLDCAN